MTLFSSVSSVRVASDVGNSAPVYTAVGADVGCDVGVGFIMEPEDVRKYWTHFFMIEQALGSLIYDYPFSIV